MSTEFSSYRQRIESSLSDWPELSWLNRFLHTPKPAKGDKTYPDVFDLINGRLVASEMDGTAASLSQTIDAKDEDSRLRIVLIGHGQSWDVDREIVDIVCSKYSIDPRFVAGHFDYPNIQNEENCPDDIKTAIGKVPDTEKYPWELGGDLMFSLTMGLPSCLFFTYRTECLSIAIHREVLKFTLILFLRAPRSPLLKTSRIFFYNPITHVTGPSLLGTRPLKSLHEEFVITLSELHFHETMTERCLILRLVLPYITNLTACCNANYHRNIAPAAVDINPFPTEGDSYFDERRRLVTLRRQVEAFLTEFGEGNINFYWEASRGRTICRLLNELIENLHSLLSFQSNEGNSMESIQLNELMEAQVNEAREARNTSVKLGYLSQLAYVFLPLQLTTSAMGMNLAIFGTGNIELRTFLAMFTTLAMLSFVPVFCPLVSFEPPINDRISQICAIFKFSRRAGFLFGFFCFFHRQSINDKLWDSGISSDIITLLDVATDDRPIGASERAKRRTVISNALRSGPFTFFPHYWQGVLDELFEIIDTPEWETNVQNDCIV